MFTKIKNIITVFLVSIFIIGFSVVGIFKEDIKISQSERRPLAQKPDVTFENITNGKFMTDFESYSLDQFPAREKFRNLKSEISFFAMGKKDNKGVYILNDYISKLEYPLDEKSIEYVSKRFNYINDKFLKDNKVYFSIIPDKNYFLASENNYPSINYTKLTDTMRKNMYFAKYIDIFPYLQIENYYKTDTHWRQEKIFDVAKVLLKNMNTPFNDNNAYQIKELNLPFYGVYYGQLALPVDAEKIYYISSNTLNNCRVFDYEENKYIGVYDFEKTKDQDLYEFFLGGSKGLITIENDEALCDKELVVFRDSFMSSLAPYFVDSYKKITLVDVRYFYPDYLGKFVNFENADCLFIYSSVVLNNGVTIK